MADSGDSAAAAKKPSAVTKKKGPDAWGDPGDWRCECEYKEPRCCSNYANYPNELAILKFESRKAAEKSFLSPEELGAAKTPCTIDRLLRHCKYPEDEDEDSRKSFLPIIIVRRANRVLLGNYKNARVKRELVLGQLKLVENKWLPLLPISERMMLFYLRTTCQLELEQFDDAKVSNDKAMEIMAEMEEDWPDFINGKRNRLKELMQVHQMIEKNGDINLPPEPVEPVLDEVNPDNPSLAKSVCVKRTKKKSGLFATKDIMPGQIIAIEEDFARVPTPKEEVCRSAERCHGCLASTFGLALPCGTCPLVVFCSLECRDLALGGFHKLECPLGLVYMQRTSAFFRSYLILRAFFSLSEEELTGLSDESLRQIKDPNGTAKTASGGNNSQFYNLFFSEDRPSVADLMASDPKLSPDLFQAKLGFILVTTLLAEAYWEPDSQVCAKIRGKEMSAMFSVFVDNQDRYSRELRSSVSVFGGEHFVPYGGGAKRPSVGTAFFSTLSLVSHSCLANASHFSPVLQTVGGYRKTILFTTRAIKAGEEITISYFEPYMNDVNGRQKFLKIEYGIKCDCLACTKGWGDLREMKGMKKVLTKFVLDDRKNKEKELLNPAKADELLQSRIQESMHWHKKMPAESYVVWATMFKHKIVSAMALKYY